MTKKGFLQIVMLIIVAVALLAYFKIDLRTFLDKPIVHKFLNIFIVMWGMYIKPLFVYLFSSVAALFGK